MCGAVATRSTVNWLMARRIVVGAAPQIPHETTPEKIGKGKLYWGLNTSVRVWPHLGGLKGISRGFGAGPAPGLGAQNSARYRTGSLTPRSGRGLENPKDYRLLGTS